MFYSISGEYNLASNSMVRDEDVIMIYPMVALGAGAIRGGCLLSWLIFPSPSIICMGLGFKLLALLVRALGGFIGYMLNMVSVNSSLMSLGRYGLVVFSGSMWFMPFISTSGVGKLPLRVGQKYHHYMDRGWSEYYGGQGFYRLSEGISKQMQLIQDNNIKVYMMVLLMWILALVFMFL